MAKEPSLRVDPLPESKTFAKHYTDGDKCKLEVATYKLVKCMLFPYKPWNMYKFRFSKFPIYSAVVSAGDWGCSIVIWIPNRGYFIHDLVLDVLDTTLVDNDKSNINQKNYFIIQRHITQLTMDFLGLIHENNVKERLFECFTDEFEVVVLNKIMQVSQVDIFESAQQHLNNGVYNRILLDFNNLDYSEVCYFCKSASCYHISTGIYYKLCKCRETYVYNYHVHIILMYHAVCPNKFEEEVYKKMDKYENIEVEHTKYIFTLGNKKFELKFKLSDFRVDDHEFSCWVRGNYLSLEKKREQFEYRTNRREIRDAIKPAELSEFADIFA